MARKKGKNHTLFDSLALERVISTYNPWWSDGDSIPETPPFKRDAFAKAANYLDENHSLALLINGPRRVGKTTIMRQLIQLLVSDKKTEATRVFFFSMDDPFIQQLPSERQGEAFEALIQAWEEKLKQSLKSLSRPAYCFLDEIQRLPRWELYIKRYVDLKYPVKFIISGSASHTIFRKSLESLLGRLIEVSLPPFSFREWLRFYHPKYATVASADNIGQIDIKDRASITAVVRKVMGGLSQEDVQTLNVLAGDYSKAGGFPQLWQIKDPVERSQFIDLQFVQRVTLEDLRLVKEIRRPEIFHQFLRYAFARTGQEYNLESIAREIKTTRATLTDALPLLLQTELILKVERFANKPVRLRSTHAKLYASDTSLYEAVTKLPADLEGEDKGQLTETLVFNVLRRLAGITDITYFRTPDGKREIDFILRIGKTYVPIEVKAGKATDISNNSMSHFLSEYTDDKGFGITVSSGTFLESGNMVNIPLGIFMLLS